MRNSLEKCTNEMHVDVFSPQIFPLQCSVMLIFISNFLYAMCWTMCGYLCLPCARETSLLETAAPAQFWRYYTGLNVFIILFFVNVIQFRRYAGMAIQALV